MKQKIITNKSKHSRIQRTKEQIRKKVKKNVIGKLKRLPRKPSVNFQKKELFVM